MTGSIPFGNIPGPAGGSWLKTIILFCLKENAVTNRFPCYSCSNSSSKPSPEPAITATGHTLPSAVQPLQPPSVRTIIWTDIESVFGLWSCSYCPYWLWRKSLLHRMRIVLCSLYGQEEQCTCRQSDFKIVLFSLRNTMAFIAFEVTGV